MSRSTTGVLRRVWNEVVDLCYPWMCALCGSTTHGEPGRFPANCYCRACNDQLQVGAEHRCERCAARVGRYTNTADGCFHCRKRNLQFEGVSCVGMYEGLLRQAVLSAKWSFSAVEIEALAGILIDRCAAEFDAASPTIVIPIPQSWRSRITRRFNPAAQIAAVVARKLNCPLEQHVLARRRHGSPQKRVAASLRLDNQKDAFRIRDRQMIDGAGVLLVDDVLTTGATCSEAARMLKACGAKSCHVAVLARVLDNSA